MSKNNIALLSVSLGGFDPEMEHEPQSMEYDHFHFNDENFPLREKAMTPRLQAKIPKMFGWQLKPGYEFYLWLDGNLTMKDPDTMKFFYDQCQDSDIVVFKHPRRDTIWWEYRYTWRGLNQSNYMINRYRGEFLDEQIEAIRADPDYEDDYLVNGGLFMYRNTPQVQEMFKQWWYHVTRYIIQDQIAFPYVLRKSGIRVKVIDLIYNDCPWIKQQGHRAKA